MQDKELLERYFSIADYIADINGSNCEVIVHDLSNFEKSIVHIVNGHVTDREIGGTITGFALDLISKEKYKNQQSITNYIGTLKDQKILRSSTYFIRNNNKETIGLLCVNIDISLLLKTKEVINDLLMTDQLTSGNLQRESMEDFNLSVDEMVDNIISSVILRSGISLSESNIEQKKELTKRFDEQGIFKFKGAVNTVAKLMNTSTQTIYRYLQEIQNKLNLR